MGLSNMSETPPTLIIGLTGASGLPYGIRLLEALVELQVEVHLVVSDSARLVYEHEGHSSSRNKIDNGDVEWDRVLDLADVVYKNSNLAAHIASGSFVTHGMIIVPCSMTTLGKIAAGIGDNLITRAAACMLKERRKLVLVPRETPLSTIHLENMARLSRAGTIIAPACPAFYNRPQNLNDNLNFMAGRVLDLFGFETDMFTRWGEGNQ